MMTMNDVKSFCEDRLEYAKMASSAENVFNFRAQAFGVVMFAQKFLPYDELETYWEDLDNGIRFKFEDIAREKRR